MPTDDARYAVQIDAHRYIREHPLARNSKIEGHECFMPESTSPRLYVPLDEAQTFHSPSAAMRAFAYWRETAPMNLKNELHKLVRVREVTERTVEVVE